MQSARGVKLVKNTKLIHLQLLHLLKKKTASLIPSTNEVSPRFFRLPTTSPSSGRSLSS